MPFNNLFFNILTFSMCSFPIFSLYFDILLILSLINRVFLFSIFFLYFHRKLSVNRIWYRRLNSKYWNREMIISILQTSNLIFTNIEIQFYFSTLYLFDIFKIEIKFSILFLYFYSLSFWFLIYTFIYAFMSLTFL